jgi:hypothetical protein
VSAARRASAPTSIIARRTLDIPKRSKPKRRKPMPHYKDGSPAQVGDLVKGKPYNTPREVVGEIVSIIPGTESCNCQVAFVERVHPEARDFYVEALRLARSADGDLIFVTVKVDYGETKAFEKIG